MEIPYVKCEGTRGNVYRPYLPVTFSYKGKRFPVGYALVDSGSDFSILPLDIAHYLEVELDDTKEIIIDCAGGGTFSALPSWKKIGYSIEKKGFRSINWEGTAYFAKEEPVVLLGHVDCLQKFDVTLRGPEKLLSVLPRF